MIKHNKKQPAPSKQQKQKCASRQQCEDCARPGNRYQLEGLYLYFCDYHIGYYAISFYEHSQGQQGTDL